MPKCGALPPRIKTLSDVEEFDDLTVDDIEEARRSLSFTRSEMAAALDWSDRKYSRTLDVARDADVVNRDFALAVRGIIEVSDEQFDEPKDLVDDGVFLNGQTYEAIFTDRCDRMGGWSADVAPHLLRLLAERAALGRGTISYGEAATALEERGLTHRVYPRTVYGRPLGLICEVLLALSDATGERIPLITAIVTKAGGDPSNGIDGPLTSFLKYHEPELSKKTIKKKLKNNRSELMQVLQHEALQYPHWPGVVRALLGRDPSTHRSTPGT